MDHRAESRHLADELQDRSSEIGDHASRVVLKQFLKLRSNEALIARMRGYYSATFNINGLEVEYALTTSSESAADIEALHMVVALIEQGLYGTTLHSLNPPLN